MPIIYLSPSTQEFNPYVNGGNEEFYMNLIADAMEPYLTASGIQYVRNSPEMTAATSIQQSNQGNYDFHLALHSNASGPAQSGQVQGTEVYYYPNSNDGRIAAEIIANNLKSIYLYPDLVKTVPTTRLGEVVRTRAPSVLIEFAYHDNYEDAQWIKDNIDEIARNVVLSLTEYFGLPFEAPGGSNIGYVNTNGSNLLLRNTPSFDAAIIGRIPNGSPVMVISRENEWYLVEYNGIRGYVYANYINV